MLMLKNEAAARDAMQETFMRVWKNRETFRSSEVPLSWLYRTSERICIDLMRKSKHEHVGQTVDALETATQRSSIMVDPDLDEHLSRVLSTFTPDLRQIAILHFVDGLTQQQIERELGVSRRTIGKKLQHIREKFAQQLGKDAQ